MSPQHFGFINVISTFEENEVSFLFSIPCTPYLHEYYYKVKTPALYRSCLSTKYFNFSSKMKESFRYKCFENDNPPVEIDRIDAEKCHDLQGNKYQENSTLYSCCDCFM